MHYIIRTCQAWRRNIPLRKYSLVSSPSYTHIDKPYRDTRTCVFVHSPFPFPSMSCCWCPPSSFTTILGGISSTILLPSSFTFYSPVHDAGGEEEERKKWRRKLFTVSSGVPFRRPLKQQQQQQRQQKATKKAKFIRQYIYIYIYIYVHVQWNKLFGTHIITVCWRQKNSFISIYILMHSQ